MLSHQLQGTVPPSEPYLCKQGTLNLGQGTCCLLPSHPFHHRHPQASPLGTHLDTSMGHKIHVFGLQCQLQTSCFPPGLGDTDEELLGPLFILAIAVCEHTWGTRETRLNSGASFGAQQGEHQRVLHSRIWAFHHGLPLHSCHHPRHSPHGTMTPTTTSTPLFGTIHPTYHPLDATWAKLASTMGYESRPGCPPPTHQLPCSHTAQPGPAFHQWCQCLPPPWQVPLGFYCRPEQPPCSPGSGAEEAREGVGL